MTKKTESPALGRREFFRKAGLGAGTVGAAAIVLTGTDAKASVAGKERPEGKGYRETGHVRKFYELARF